MKVKNTVIILIGFLIALSGMSFATGGSNSNYDNIPIEITLELDEEYTTDNNTINTDAFFIRVMFTNQTDKAIEKFKRENISKQILSSFSTHCSDEAVLSAIEVGKIGSDTYKKNIRSFVNDDKEYQECEKSEEKPKDCQMKFYKAYYDAIRKYEGTENIVEPGDSWVIEVIMQINNIDQKKSECSILFKSKIDTIMEKSKSDIEIESNTMKIIFDNVSKRLSE